MPRPGAVPVFAKEAEVARGVATAARIKLSAAVDALVADHALDLLGRRHELARELQALDAAVLAS
jgi:hypothetical protein